VKNRLSALTERGREFSALEATEKKIMYATIH